MKKKITVNLALLCILLLPMKANASKNINVSSGVVKDVYSMLKSCNIKENTIKKVKAVRERSKRSERHVRRIEKSVPRNSSFKSYMDARCITNRGSEQYKLKSKYRLDESGIYKVNGRYCVAVGSYYTTKIGTKLDVVLESGNVIKCILADCKANAHTDSTNRQNPNGSVVEFIVYTPLLHRMSKRMGDCSYVDGFNGDIEKIVIIEEE